MHTLKINHRISLLFWLFTSTSIFSAHTSSAFPHTTPAGDTTWVREHYNKFEYRIPMRDGVKLFTIVYVPKDKSQAYPMLMNRTPYAVAPYGKDAFRAQLGPSSYLMKDKYIFVYQDVRGRYMSEGQYDNMRPNIPGQKNKKDIDESSDTFDTIEWLLKNVKDHNGKVGQWGISYPGFYTAAALPDAHPALVASSPQAPISDFFFDDFHHQGAYLQSYWLATSVFGYQKDTLTTQPWYTMVNPGTGDGYEFYYNMGPLKNAGKYYGKDNFFWQQLKDHPNYDAFWQKRNLLPHLKDIDHAVMTVGGWFDAEDLYGPLHIYKTIEKTSPEAYNMLVMGPWSHGDWARNTLHQMVGNIYFGDSLSAFYQREIEYPFFHHFLKGGDGSPKLPEAYCFDTGTKVWKKFDAWPPENLTPQKLYFDDGGELSLDDAEDTGEPFDEFVSDPMKPVPYSEDIKIVFTPRKYMSDDHRFAAHRPDVLVYETDALPQDITLAGEIMANLQVSTTGTDADWVVKLIDVYPDDEPNDEHTPQNIELGGYQQMVRSEVMRARFRNSFEKPEPFVPNQVTEVNLPLQDVLHTFRKGHRIMIQVQSTWFPLIDRNPQKYVENIFEADSADFIKATHRFYHTSSISVGVLSGKEKVGK